MDVRPLPDWVSIPAMLRDQAAKHPGDLVVKEGEERLTLGELRERAAEVARSLLALGVATGDRVSVWAPNTARWVVTAYGLWDAGGVVAPLSTRFKGLEAVEFLDKVEASVLFVDEGFMGVSHLALLAEAGGGPVDGRPYERLPHLRHVVSYGVSDGRPGVLTWAEFLERGAAVSAGEAEERALSITGDDLGEIMSTSGTTGTPKGVMLHQAQLLRGYWDWSELVTLGPGDRYPIIAPFSHGFGINAGLLACVLRRAVMMPIPLFEPDRLLDLIEAERVSVTAGAPAMFFKILDQVAGRDVGSLRVLICGAAAVPAELIRKISAVLGLERVINAYGLMEGTVVSMTRPEDPVEVIANSTGRAVPGVSLRIVDDAGDDLPLGERGEILIGGYGVMRGYWRDPEKTAEAVDSDGWLHSGDVGTLDEHGNLAIVDRKKEMFIVSGFNAYPAEIESLLLRFDGIGQAGVIGVPDERQGEVGWAYVVPKDPELTPEAVIAWARANMSNYKVPRRVILVDALPISGNGKTDKKLLREWAAEAG